MKQKLPVSAILFITFLSVLSSCSKLKQQELPNILWITSEDNSPFFLGCYGEEFATTPNLDKLASEGFLYTHAYANAPVCAPARNTIITGVYACSGGNQHMRSRYDKSDIIQYYPQFFRQMGYYCTNHSKEDYNIDLEQTIGIWDESSDSAHYNNRKQGQPFFAVFNTHKTHENRIHKSIPTEELRHDPNKVKLPPYHPDTPEMRHDWAQYYDKVEDMDAWVGRLLKELDESGEAENTIVFYYADHGGVLGRSKRYVYESGTHVPFIVRIPEKFKYLYPAAKPGAKIDRLISFVDLAPTLLSIAGIPIPEWMQGNAFLGEQKTPDPEYAFMFRGRMDERYDMVRAVRDNKYRYIRNYMPYRISGQRLAYMWRAPSMQSWERAYLDGKCNETQSVFWKTKPVEELYDTENDPWEVNNLAGNPAYENVLAKMREVSHEWCVRINDTGFIPEADFIDRVDMPVYDYMRSGRIKLEPIIDAAEIATKGEFQNLEKLKGFLKNEESAIRYWGAVGLLILNENAGTAKENLREALVDKSSNVAIVAAEALYKLGEKEEARKALLSVLKQANEIARCHALNTIDYTGDKSPDIVAGVVNMLKNSSQLTSRQYDIRVARWLLEKWGLDAAEYGIEFGR